jgi:hypothetical protein
MKTMTKILASAVAAALLGVAAPASAKLSDAEIARLGADLTPVGAEKAGNKDGTIPAWTGGLCAPPAGWTAAQGYVDPFASDKVLFTITKANAAQYKDKLTPGTLALLDKYDNYKMNVYQTRRTACYPQEVYDAVKAQAGKVELQGFGISNRGNSTVPFPIPKSGMEAIWNHTMRYLGGGVDRNYHSFPVRANGDFYKIGAHEFRIFNQNMDPPQDNLLLGFLSYFTAPATLEGTVFLVHEPVDQVKQARSAWIYNAGQRRVRRAPDLAYDNVNDGTEGIRTTDDFDGFNGAPDRYDWKIVGKKEIYIPLQLVQARRQEAQVQGRHDPQEHAECGPAALRAAPGVGDRGHAEGRQQAHLRQARLLPRRGHLDRRLPGRVRHAQAAVARARPPDDAVLRREGAVVPLQHLARPVERQLPVLVARQRGQAAVEVRRKGQVGRLPARLAAPALARSERLTVQNGRS